MADNDFKCPVCLDDLKEPRMLLPCTHTLCTTPCLQQLLNQATRGKIRCPLCMQDVKVPSQGAQGFPRNIYVGNDLALGSVTQIQRVTVGQSARDEFKVGDVKVLLYNQSIIELRGLDAILSPTNSDLDQTSGVANAIAQLAGDTVKTECKDYIKSNGRVNIGEVFVSSPGRLPCKGIVHAVGPEWNGYSKEVKTICAQDLYNTVIRILMAVKNKGWFTVGLCAIGCGQGGIPKQLCAEMYMKAILDSRQTAARNLTAIHFVDIDSEILEMISTAHREWMANNDVLDFKNALRYQ